MASRTFRIQGAAGVRPAFRAAWDLVQGLMRETGAGYELVLRPLKSKRSLDQNRRYWKLLLELSDVAWVGDRQFTKDAWHEYFKREFIGIEELPGGGQIGISTAKLSVEEFGNYMTRIEQWAAEQGWPLMLEGE
ncbi:recombination protein NinB [Halopseudomonas sp. SMJS2]|uniref:recombination protein NinB n=1 Tax=Halopseudomonas sp. SMJS2 TaxID=3041098 RepID=UPI0024529FAF|nr:recombination protein NinB [Halopseudomonas sp. SMJS2]WGK60531.1 recombination protein NinB [Halopseudomonas sp. SMJS2]